MNKTVIMLTIFLTFGFTSSGALANSNGPSYKDTDSGNSAFPSDKSTNAKAGNRQFVVYGSGGGAFPPDKDNAIATTSFCILDVCLSFGD